MIVIHVKRVYEPADPQDGMRVLVDRLWPRGISKEQLKADLWLKEVAPSTALRQWFHSDLSEWEEFQRRYTAELDEHRPALRALLERAAGGTITLMYSTRDIEHNHAQVLRDYLLRLEQAE
mgnify:CR=1 FL=1